MTGEIRTHAADRLLDAIDQCGAPVCVGIDPVVERIPFKSTSPTEALRSFTLGILEAVADVVPCVKFQSACYERYRHDGVRVLYETIAQAKTMGLEVILDAKRGDIGVTAEHYAAAAFGGDHSPDWLTINSYLGADGIEPLLVDGHGAFALVRTSNPGGDALQSKQLTSGETLAEFVATMIRQIGAQSIGQRGYSALGAVVGATKPQDAQRLRALLPEQLFLIPGYGAQGGSVQDILPCFQPDALGKLSGGIVTASRSVIYAQSGYKRWTEAVHEAALRFADEIGSATGAR